jgi:Tol biopolymer transport system component
MKNFLKTSLYLVAFAFAGIIFQISCSNSENINSVQNIGKLVYLKQLSGAPIEIWSANSDGSSQTQIPISLPANVEFSSINNNRASVKISPDGQKIFFIGFNNTTNISSIYSCDFDGNNLQEIISGGNSTVLELGGIN